VNYSRLNGKQGSIFLNAGLDLGYGFGADKCGAKLFLPPECQPYGSFCFHGKGGAYAFYGEGALTAKISTAHARYYIYFRHGQVHEVCDLLPNLKGAFVLVHTASLPEESRLAMHW